MYMRLSKCVSLSAFSHRGHDETPMYVYVYFLVGLCVRTQGGLSACVRVYICACVYLMCCVGVIILHLWTPGRSKHTHLHPPLHPSSAQEQCSPGGLSSLLAPMTDVPVEHPGSTHRATVPHTHVWTRALTHTDSHIKTHAHTQFGRGSSFMKRTKVFRYETIITLFFNVLFR